MDPDADTANLIFRIIFILILIIFSAFFSSAETSFMAVDKLRLKQLVHDNDKHAIRVNNILKQESKLLSTILIGNNCVNLFASSLTTTLVYDLWGNTGASVATGILTFFILIFGEIIPKTVASKHAEKIVFFYAPFISFLMFALRPIIFIVNGFCHGIMRLFKIKNNKEEPSVTEEMIKTMLDVSKEEQQIEIAEHEIIKNVFDLNDSCAKDIMVPRNSIVGIKINSTYDEIMKIFNEEKYTRLVVFSDDKEDVIGILNVKDLLGINKASFHVKDYLRKPYIVYDSKKISDLLPLMKKTSNNMAVVRDEYGCIAGILTFEDILEEIVGEIQDEYDTDENNPIEKIDDSTFIVDGLTPISNVNEKLKLNLEADESNTLGGFVIENIEDLPKKGDSLDIEKCYIEVLNIIENRIGKIKIVIKKVDTPA